MDLQQSSVADTLNSLATAMLCLRTWQRAGTKSIMFKRERQLFPKFSPRSANVRCKVQVSERLNTAHLVYGRCYMLIRASAICGVLFLKPCRTFRAVIVLCVSRCFLHLLERVMCAPHNEVSECNTPPPCHGRMNQYERAYGLIFTFVKSI